MPQICDINQNKTTTTKPPHCETHCDIASAIHRIWSIANAVFVDNRTRRTKMSQRKRHLFYVYFSKQ